MFKKLFKQAVLTVPLLIVGFILSCLLPLNQHHQIIQTQGEKVESSFVNAGSKLDGVSQVVEENITTADFEVVSPKKVEYIKEKKVGETFEEMKRGFRDFSFDIESDSPINNSPINNGSRDEIHVTSRQIIDEELEETYELGTLKVTSSYTKESLAGLSKQTYTIENPTNHDQTITLSSRFAIPTDKIEWDGKEYEITDAPRTFQIYEKTASIPEFAQDIGQDDLEGLQEFDNYQHTYKVGGSISFITDSGDRAFYDWMDVENAGFDHELSVFKYDGRTWVQLTVNADVPAYSQTVIDPAFGLIDESNYNIRYDGASSNFLTRGGAIAIGDVNGDSYGDLVLGSMNASNNGAGSGSAWVIFGGANIGVGNKPLSTSTNYNIRYDGGANSDNLTRDGAMAIGDVNGDSKGDLILGAFPADNNGSDSGSAWVMFSTLIDDVGTSTGNNKPLSTSTNYNIRYDGRTANDKMTEHGSLIIGDVNGDDKSDLILCGKEYESGTQHYGVAYVVFSTLIDDVGTSTGNNKPFSTSTNYNIAYRGAASAHYLTWGKTLTVGDINGDSNGDLVLGAYGAGNNGDDSGSVWVMFSTLIDDVGTSTGNYKPLSTSTDYNIRYDGGAAGEWLIQSGILAIGDVNGDSNGDLILGAYRADNNGTDSGSAWVMFSTLIDDVGTSTGNNKPLSTTTNYNIRYDGGSAGDQLTFSGLAIGDVNGSSNSDLVLGASSADNNGTNSGSVWVMFSTLIDDVGTSTGNNKLLSTTANYNIRYDGGEANDKLTYDKTLTIGDINGDSNGDLVLGTYYAGNNGVKSGSAWVMFSTLIDDVGTSTGNNKPLSTTTNYNIRYDGGGTGDRLTEWGSLAIGDINGDSKGDLVLGAAYADNIGTDSGSAYVMFSQPTATSAPIKAYESNDTAVTASSPGTEAGPAVLSKVYSDDSNRWRTALSATGSGYDSQVFKFQPDFSGISTPKITISWNGYGDASATGTNTYLNIWNFTSSAWEQLDSGDCDTDCDLSGFKTGTNYKDGSDYVWAWVKADNEFSAPVISDISSGTPTFQDATITWSTDISADAMVGFHTSSHSGGGWDDYPWQDNDGGETGNTSHSIYLGGLADGTTYYYRVRSADADGDFAVSSENSFTTATLSCPWIWSWNGEKFIWDDEANPNFIMREFKGDDYSRLPNLKLVNGEYKIKITEYLPETSYFDKVELVNIKHPEHTEVYTGHDNKLYTIQKKTAPVSAVDGAGNDLLGEIIKDDEVYWNYFEISGNPWVDDDGDGLADSTEECSKYNYLYLEFPKPKEAQRVNIISKQKVTSAWSWQQVYGFLVDHPDIREKSLGGVIELLNHSPFYYTIWNGIDWTGETAIMEFPGNKASTVVYPADISEIKTETLKVRIMTDPYAGKMLLDYIAVDYSEPSDFTVERIKPLNNEKLLEIDDDCVVLDHDEIEIVFKDNNEGQDMPDGYKITHFLDVNGYHEDYPLYDIEIDEATFYKLAKYDRDYTSRFWRPKWTEYEKMRALSIDNFQSEVDYELEKIKVTLGDSLWKISERVYGDPYRWVEIYEANIDKIENPDLIYSGQELELRLHSANTDKISVAVEEGPSNSVPTNDSLTFTNPYGGSGNDAVADDYTEWNFRAVVTDTDGYTNLDTVVLRLANSSDNTTPYDALKFTWTESTDAFSETTDTQNAATITSTGSDSSCDGNTCTLDFKIKLNNNFLAKDTNYNAELYTTDDDPATDEDTYTNFYQVTTVTIAITSPSDVNLGTITGTGSSNVGEATWTVTTNNGDGYKLEWQASTAAMTSGADTISAYTPAVADTPETWSVGASDSEWGGRLKSTSTDYNSGTWGTDDSGNAKWLNVKSASVFQVITRSSATSGSNEIIQFFTEVGLSKFQPTGDYTVNITVTATTL